MYCISGPVLVLRNNSLRLDHRETLRFFENSCITFLICKDLLPCDFCDFFILYKLLYNYFLFYPYKYVRPKILLPKWYTTLLNKI